MRTDPAKAGRKPGEDADDADERQDERPGERLSWWRRWRSWLPIVLKPLRRGIVIFALLLIVEYLVVPELVGASRDLYLLGRVNAFWLAGGVILEFASLFCYGLLTRALLPPGAHNPGLSVLFRIDLAAAASASCPASSLPRPSAAPASRTRSASSGVISSQTPGMARATNAGAKLKNEAATTAALSAPVTPSGAARPAK